MKGWIFTDTHTPLVLGEVEQPTPGPGEVVLDVKAAGLCHSDVGALEDPQWLNVITSRPVVFGHEIAGTICELGDGVTDFSIGQEVGVCPASLRGGSPGYTRDGGFTFKHRAPAEDLVPMPRGLAFELAAVGTDAGMTSHHAMVTRGEAQAGMKVGVIGLGGLGQIGARVAVLRGAEVHVAEVNTAVWSMADAIGIASVAKSIDEYAGQDFDLIVDYAGTGGSTRGAMKAIRAGGRVVVVGMGSMEITVDTMDLILKRAHLMGSLGGTKEDVAAVYGYLARGELEPVVNVIGFDDIPQGLDDLKHHRVIGRVVARIGE